MEDFKINQLTKELVTIRLKNMGDPCAAAAELVKKTLEVALKGIKPGDAGFTILVRDACQGGMTGLLIAEQPLPKGAVLMLEAVVEIGVEFGVDPTQTMKAALEGIADLRRFLPPDKLYEITHEIDIRFMGAGDAFREILRAQESASADALK